MNLFYIILSTVLLWRCSAWPTLLENGLQHLEKRFDMGVTLLVEHNSKLVPYNTTSVHLPLPDSIAAYPNCTKFSSKAILDILDPNHLAEIDSTMDLQLKFHIDYTCSIEVLAPNPFLTFEDYYAPDCIDCGQVAYVINSQSTNQPVTVKIQTGFAVRFCCGSGDCAKMLPKQGVKKNANDGYGMTLLDDQQRISPNDQQVDPRCVGHKNRGRTQDGWPYPFPGQQVYVSDQANCMRGGKEGCVLTVSQSLTVTDGITTSKSYSGSVSVSSSSQVELNLFGLKMGETVTLGTSQGWCDSTSKDHSVSELGSTSQSFTVPPGRTGQVLFTAQATATDFYKCKKGKEFRWAEITHVKNAEGKVMGQYTLVLTN